MFSFLQGLKRFEFYHFIEKMLLLTYLNFPINIHYFGVCQMQKLYLVPVKPQEECISVGGYVWCEL